MSSKGRMLLRVGGKVNAFCLPCAAEVQVLGGEYVGECGPQDGCDLCEVRQKGEAPR